MTQHLPAVSDRSQSSSRPSPVLPDEKFWQHYSPHHEAPLSGVASLALHVLVVAAVVLACYYFGKSTEIIGKPTSVALVRVDGLEDLGTAKGAPGGSEGLPQGDGNQRSRENIGDTPVQLPDVKPRPTLPEPQIAISPVPDVSAPPQPDNLVRDSREAMDAMERTTLAMRDLLLKGVGSGPRGDRGRGPGSGSNGGPNMGGEARKSRILRWKLVFTTKDGKDYAQQLQALGAILAFADAKDPMKFHVIRDLRAHPAVARVEEITRIERIFWIDDRPDSVKSLAVALEIKPVPTRIVAFFPEELEKKLVELERDYNGLAEEDVGTTVLEVRSDGTGKFRPKVVSQTAINP